MIFLYDTLGLEIKFYLKIALCIPMQVPKRSAIKECPSPRDADVLEA